MSLIEKERFYEGILGSLHDLSVGNLKISDTDEILEKLKKMTLEWDKLLNSGVFTKTLNQVVKNINVAKLEGDVDSQEKNLRLLYLIISPLEHYMISLEEMKVESFRDAVIRCGIVCERLVNKLLFEICYKDSDMNKFSNNVGILQRELEQRKVTSVKYFCGSMSEIYDIRNTRGPHDVPCAEEIEAKFCIASMPLIYSRYMDILEFLGYDLKGIRDDLVSLANEIIIIGTLLPTVGKKGKGLKTGDVLIDLYRQGFFSKPREFSEIENRLMELGYNIDKSTLSHALVGLCEKGVLHRSGKRRHFKYSQKMPSTEYFK